MSENYNFPEIVPINPRFGVPDDPWDTPMGIEPWIDANIHRYLFDLEAIRGEAVKFRYADVFGPNTCGVYFLQWGGDIVYIGKASNIASRLRAHWMGDKTWTHFWCITGMPKEIMPDVEGMYIQWLKPILNIKPEFCCEVAEGLIKGLPDYQPFVGITYEPVSYGEQDEQ